MDALSRRESKGNFIQKNLSDVDTD